MRKRLGLLGLALGVAVSTLAAGEEVLVVEQEYREVAPTRSEGRDVRQVLYFTAEAVRIEEYAQGPDEPTEVQWVNFKAERIERLWRNHGAWTLTAESFERRRERLQARVRKQTEDSAELPDGAQRSEAERLLSFRVDARRSYEAIHDKTKTKPMLDAHAEHVTIVDRKEDACKPLEGYFHPSMRLPCATGELLYLLDIIPEKLSRFLARERETFDRVPVELKLRTSHGGLVETRLQRAERVPEQSIPGDLFDAGAELKRIQEKSAKPLPASEP